MPGPNIRNRAREEKQAALAEYQTYYLTDPSCKEIHGVAVTDHIRANGLRLTSGEASALVAAGALTTDKAHADKVAADLKDRVAVLAEKRKTAADAAAAGNEAAADAALHNAGEPARPGDGSKTSGEVDQLMREQPAPPASQPQPAAAEPPPVSAEQPAGTWADHQQPAG